MQIDQKTGEDMNQYVISYLGGDQPSAPEEGRAHFAKYREWLGCGGEADGAVQEYSHNQPRRNSRCG